MDNNQLNNTGNSIPFVNKGGGGSATISGIVNSEGHLILDNNDTIDIGPNVTSYINIGNDMNTNTSIYGLTHIGISGNTIIGSDPSNLLTINSKLFFPYSESISGITFVNVTSLSGFLPYGNNIDIGFNSNTNNYLLGNTFMGSHNNPLLSLNYNENQININGPININHTLNMYSDAYFNYNVVFYNNVNFSENFIDIYPNTRTINFNNLLYLDIDNNIMNITANYVSLIDNNTNKNVMIGIPTSGIRNTTFGYQNLHANYINSMGGLYNFVLNENISGRTWSSMAMSDNGQYQTFLAGRYLDSWPYGNNIDYIYVSQDYGNTVIIANCPYIVWSSVAVSSTGQYQVATAYGDYIYYSSNYGLDWSIIYSNDTNWSCVAISANGRYIVAGIENGSVYLSTDSGNSFNNIGSSLGNQYWSSVAISSDGDIIGSVGGIVGTAHSGYVYKYANGTWNILNGTYNKWVKVLMSDTATYITCIARNDSIYVSSNGGVSFDSKVSQNAWTCGGMSHDGQYQIVAGSYGATNIYISTDYGVTWNENNLNNNFVGIGISANGIYSTALVFDGSIYNSNTNLSHVGNYNTMLGYRAGYNEIGDFNTYLGYNAGSPAGSIFYQSTALGANTVVTDNHQIVIGTIDETTYIAGNMLIGTDYTSNLNINSSIYINTPTFLLNSGDTNNVIIGSTSSGNNNTGFGCNVLGSLASITSPNNLMFGSAEFQLGLPLVLNAADSVYEKLAVSFDGSTVIVAHTNNSNNSNISNMYISRNGGVLYSLLSDSHDNAYYWGYVSASLSVSGNGNNIIIIRSDYQTLYSTDNGNTFNISNFHFKVNNTIPLPNNILLSNLQNNGNYIAVLSELNTGILYSHDGGANFNQSLINDSYNTNVKYNFIMSNDASYIIAYESTGSVFYSTDFGIIFNSLDNNNYLKVIISGDGANIIGIRTDGTLYKSTNNSNNLVLDNRYSNCTNIFLSNNGDHLVVISDGYLYYSNDFGNNYVGTGLNIDVYSCDIANNGYIALYGQNMGLNQDIFYYSENGAGPFSIIKNKFTDTINTNAIQISFVNNNELNILVTCNYLLFSLQAGSNNVAIGFESGIYEYGSNNCYIGYNTGPDISNYYYKSIAIGANAQINDNNQVMIGSQSENVYIPGSLYVGYDNLPLGNSQTTFAVINYTSSTNSNDIIFGYAPAIFGNTIFIGTDWNTNSYNINFGGYNDNNYFNGYVYFNNGFEVYGNFAAFYVESYFYAPLNIETLIQTPTDPNKYSSLSTNNLGWNQTISGTYGSPISSNVILKVTNITLPHGIYMITYTGYFYTTSASGSLQDFQIGLSNTDSSFVHLNTMYVCGNNHNNQSTAFLSGQYFSLSQTIPITLTADTTTYYLNAKLHINSGTFALDYNLSVIKIF